MTTTTLPFPQVELTKIHGKPTAASIKQLKQEIYANFILLIDEQLQLPCRLISL
jgi:hypothetical protein